MKSLITSLLLTIVLTVILGLLYPLAMTGLAQVIFPHQANGSLIERDGRIVGSELIGQSFADPKFFHGRPSASGTGYDAANSSGTNLGPTSSALMNRLQHDRDSLIMLYPELATKLPADMLTTSASGLDPDISIANARLQVPIVARVNGLSPDAVMHLVDSHVEGRDLGFLGEPHVNVLKLNLDLLALTQKR